MKDNPGIVFYGTPEFAVASLAGLDRAGFRILAVVTAPDKPSGRGLRLTVSPVKQFALENNLPLLQPVNLRDQSFITELRTLQPDLQVVVAFRMLPKEVWALPALGTFNLHASLLPQYRGAAPINHVLINGETETGITTFLIDEKIDTGNIIYQESMNIDENDTAGELHDRLMESGALLVVRTAESIAAGNVRPIPQEKIMRDGSPLKMAPKIHPEDCKIDWTRSTRDIHNLIRGLSPYPGAHTVIHSNQGEPYYLKIYRDTPEETDHNYSSGKIITDGRSFMKIATKDGWIRLTQVQASGRKPMNIGDFLMGSGRYFV